MKNWKFTLLAVTTVALLTITYPVRAGVVHDEAVDGDLSTDPDAPTVLDFTVGSNTVIGTMGAPDDIRDFITFTVPADHGLTALLLLNYEDIPSGDPGNRGYHAINAGATSYIPDPDNTDLFLGGDHLDPEPSGTDLLPDLAAAPLAGTGFVVPLGQGTYSYVVQQTGADFTGYSIEFVIEPRSVISIPALDSFGLALFAVVLAFSAAVVLRQRTQRRRQRVTIPR